MLTVIFTLRLPDGAVITAKAKALSPVNRVGIEWTGPKELLGAVPIRTDVPFLEFVFRRAEEELGAELTIAREGRYDLELDADAGPGTMP